MKEKNEIVSLDLGFECRNRLHAQILEQAKRQGFKIGQINELNLGFELPQGWPYDINSSPTLAQLVVIAEKLKMNIIISNLDMFGGERL
jgi:hypothetical protein